MKVCVAQPSDLGSDEISRWHQMQGESDSLGNPFLSPEFAVAVARCRPTARVAVLTEGMDVVGFFPFESHQLRVGLPIGAAVNNCHGVVHVPGFEWDVASVLGGCRLSVWKFHSLAEGQKSLEPYVSGIDAHAVMDVGGGFGSYFDQLRTRSPRFWKNIDRKIRRLEREFGAIRFVSHSRDHDDLYKLMQWKSMQCRRNDWLDIFGRSWVVQLVDSLLDEPSGAFGSALSVLYAGDDAVAAHLGLRMNDRLVGWFTAYDPRFRHCSPGIIHFVKLAESMAEAGIRTIELGATSEFKQRLSSYVTGHAWGIAARNSFMARSYGMGNRLELWARYQIRRYPPLFRAADQVLMRFNRVI